MGRLIQNIGGGGGISSDEVTATRHDVLKGKTALTVDSNDEVATGTLELTGNAADDDVLKGQTYYNTDAHGKRTGTLELTGNAADNDVLSGLTYYNTDAKTKRTGALALTGSAADDDVLKGETYYNTDAHGKRTGTLELTGNSADADVLEGKTYYNTDAKAKRTGTMPNRGWDAGNAMNFGASSGKPNSFYAKFPRGAYFDQQPDAPGAAVFIPFSEVVSEAGITAAKLAVGQKILGVTGTYKGRGNATAAQVLTGHTFSTASLDNASGTMPNQGAKTASLNAGGSYTIPAGYHNGSGKVTANSLSSQTSATAGAGDIRSGKTAWVNGSRISGTLAVTSAISFSAAALSSSKIRISWKNPSKGPWQGVFIQMSTSGNPGASGGTRAYTGAGNNPSSAGGSNYVDITGLAAGTTYYFTCTSYCNNLGNGASYNVSAATWNSLVQVFPTGAYTIYQYWCVKNTDSYAKYYTATASFSGNSISFKPTLVSGSFGDNMKSFAEGGGLNIFGMKYDSIPQSALPTFHKHRLQVFIDSSRIMDVAPGGWSVVARKYMSVYNTQISIPNFNGTVNDVGAGNKQFRVDFV